MSPTAFAYIVILTVLLAAAAAALESGTRGRGTARHLWTAVIILAVVAPAGALAWHSFADRATTPSVDAASGPAQLATIVVNSGRNTVRRASDFFGRDALIRTLLPGRRAIRAALAQLNRSFSIFAIAAWACLSLALVAWLAFGVFHWRRAQRAWRRTTLDGVSIDVSVATGPAVVGLLSHRIVLPSWATKMQPEHRRLVLAHESEHIVARDPERLFLAILALVLMPWNIGLWWCAARLRRAIELDCDMRVLRRFPSAKEYGYVLLEVASRGRSSGPLAVPMVGLLRLPSELELRLRAMSRAHAVGTRSLVGGAIAALVAITVALTTPVPTLALHNSSAATVRRYASDAGTHALLLPASHDTGSKRRTDSLAILKAQNDSLRATDRALMSQLRSTRRTIVRFDSAQTALIFLQRSQALEIGEPKGKPRHAISNMTYFSFQVEKQAAQAPGSPTPSYPQTLQSAGIEGEVDAQFVVDTTGRADPSTLKIEKSTNDLFTAAVRSALPRMRFYPAEIGGKKVRQLVQQPFTFSITH